MFSIPVFARAFVRGSCGALVGDRASHRRSKYEKMDGDGLRDALRKESDGSYDVTKADHRFCNPHGT